MSDLFKKFEELLKKYNLTKQYADNVKQYHNKAPEEFCKSEPNNGWVMRAFNWEKVTPNAKVWKRVHKEWVGML
jgi:hypothetical protein